MLLKLASDHIPLGVPERALMEDVFVIGRDASQNVMATATANHQNHVIYERLLLTQRDSRPHVRYLDARMKAQARVAPSDSNQYVFGTEYVQFEKDLKDHLELNKVYRGESSKAPQECQRYGPWYR